MFSNSNIHFIFPVKPSESLINTGFDKHISIMRKVYCDCKRSRGQGRACAPVGFSLDADAATQPRPMGGFGAAKATLEPHGGEWLPRRGTGRGESNCVVRRIPEPLGDDFQCFTLGECVKIRSFLKTQIWTFDYGPFHSILKCVFLSISKLNLSKNNVENLRREWSSHSINPFKLISC